MKFRKKPVIIEAHRWEGKNYPFFLDFIGVGIDQSFDQALIIHTLEGDMRAEKGDWIIKGVKGECYPCKPDIFEQTYEKVED
jgi:hypothetical protein